MKIMLGDFNEKLGRDDIFKLTVLLVFYKHSIILPMQ
jgi:hypothetical protein